MAIGHLYLDVPSGVFITVNTLLGPMFVTALPGEILRKGKLEVSLNLEMGALRTPLRFYDVRSSGGSPATAASPVDTGGRLRSSTQSARNNALGFIGPGRVEKTARSIVFRYARKPDRPPGLIYKAQGVCVYHAPNTATAVILASIPTEIHELLLSI